MGSVALRFHHADHDQPACVLIIAELGVNHDGDRSRAGELLDAAAQTGADAVKLQYFRADRLISRDARLARYQRSSADDAYAMLAARELSFDTMQALRRMAADRGLGFMLTPFSLADIADLEALDVDAVKIASPDAVNAPLIEAAAALNAPLFISTGTCSSEELRPAADQVHHRAVGGALLQCVSSYPTPRDHAALGGIRALRETFAVATGYSDHTMEEQTGALAVAAGACVLEKHLTLDRAAAGPDHAASLEPESFARYVEQARDAARMLGPIVQAPQSIEAEVTEVSRQSVCAARALPAEHVLAAQDLTIKRPGSGIPAAALRRVLGRKTTRAIDANRLLRWDDLADEPS